MRKYIDTEKLKAEIERYKKEAAIARFDNAGENAEYFQGKVELCDDLTHIITSLQQEQPANMIQWTGSNLQEVIDFTGKSPKFGGWFKSWEEYENYVHTHNDILKLFCEDGSHFEVPVGAWIIKTPDGYNVPSVARFIHAKQEQPDVDLEKFTEKIKTFQARYKYPEIVSVKGAMAFMARMFYQYPNVARQWYEQLPKATMD